MSHSSTPACTPTATRPDVGRPVTRAELLAAHAVPITVLPAGLWRVVLGLGVPLGFSATALEADGMPGWGTVWVVFLTLLTEALALLSLGLVRPWGEVVPDWVPGLAGRRIPPLPVVLVSGTGGVVLTVMWTFAFLGLLPVTGLDRVDHFTGGPGWRTLLIACYAPALLWGPILLWLSYAYHRRRTS
jgi:hypothetical protein